MVTYKCEFARCDWEAKTETVTDYVALYQIHVQALQPNTGTAVTSKAEKAKTPELSSDILEKDWSYFTTRWTQYKNCLLYTSPSPRDGLLSRMPSSA